MELSIGAAEQPLPRLTWRPMAAGDLDGVVEVAREAFSDHPEDRACFENRLMLYPRGCFVLAAGDGAVAGYLVAYPYRKDEAPLLNTCLDALPPGADVLYLHDLALAPWARGAGQARPIVERLVDQARSDGWPALTLVAVNRAAPVWERLGFAAETPPGMADKLASYGSDARYMVRPL